MTFIEVSYIPGEDGGAVESCSKQDPGYLNRLRQEGWRVYSPGNGWAYLSKPPQIKVKVDESYFDVIGFFREKIGRITAKRAKIILETVPEEVDISENQLSAAFMDEWLRRVKKRI